VYIFVVAADFTQSFLSLSLSGFRQKTSVPRLHTMAKSSFTLAVIVSLFVPGVAAAPIEEKDVQDAQKAWADGIVNIGKMHGSGKSADYIRAVSDELLDGQYAYKNVGADVKVLLRVSPAAGKTGVGLTRDDAFQYLFGQDPSNQEVRGFALRPWSGIRFENGGIVRGETAMAMGRCFLTDNAAAETVAEFTFGYIRDNTGTVRINLQHLSMPAAPTTSSAEVSSAKDSSHVLKKDAAPAAPEKSATGTVLKKDAADGSTTTTTAIPAPSTTAAAESFFSEANMNHRHVLHKDEKIGRQTKAPSESSGFNLWGWLSLCCQILAVVSILSSIFVAHSVSQMKSHPGMSLSDKISGAFGMSASQKVKKTDGCPLETAYDKHV
jgi:hypothetical protein